MSDNWVRNVKNGVFRIAVHMITSCIFRISHSDLHMKHVKCVYYIFSISTNWYILKIVYQKKRQIIFSIIRICKLFKKMIFAYKVNFLSPFWHVRMPSWHRKWVFFFLLFVGLKCQSCEKKGFLKQYNFSRRFLTP